jgi:protein-S-isoprenylcysteine O-methyltransferase Ste14
MVAVMAMDAIRTMLYSFMLEVRLPNRSESTPERRSLRAPRAAICSTSFGSILVRYAARHATDPRVRLAHPDRASRSSVMFTLVRALTYATLFAGLLLWFVPATILTRTGLRAPARFGVAQALGMAVGLAGLGLALGCVLAFATLGKGTPAPFDPPRRLVTAGPYRLLRNPMYLGAALWVLGVALFYQSPWVALYAGGFLACAHVFVVRYEEPELERLFGGAYRDYCHRVRRW